MGKQLVHGVTVSNVGLCKKKVRVSLQPRQTGLFEGYVVIAVEVIHTDDMLALGQKTLGAVHADETGAAGDEGSGGKVHAGGSAGPDVRGGCQSSHTRCVRARVNEEGLKAAR